MGVLDEQRISRRLSNRKVGRAQLQERERIRTRSFGALPAVQGDRRRPERGAERVHTSDGVRAVRQARAGWVALALGGFAVLLALPLQLLWLATRPRELWRRTVTLPDRSRSVIRRVRMDARDPGTTAGKLAETLHLAGFLVREEVRDMQGGFPTGEMVVDALRRTGDHALENTGRFLGIDDPMRPDLVGERVRGALALGLVGAAAVVGLFIATYQSLELVKQSDRLALRTVDVVGVERTAADAVRGQLALTLGSNLLELDATEALARAEALPWVESVTAVRDLREQRVVVRVVEYQPALLLAGGPLRLVDSRGRDFKTLEPGDPHDFPLLTGLPEDPAARAAELPHATRGALDILESAAAGSALTRGDVSEIRWGVDEGFVVITRDGLPLKLGHRDFAARLGRLERAMAAGGLVLEDVASLDLALNDRIVAVPRAPRERSHRSRRPDSASAHHPPAHLGPASDET